MASSNVQSPRNKFTDDQDITSFDIDDYFNNFIAPIDQIRSRFNALIPDSEYSGPNGFQESRCHAFFRMIGFPIVGDSGSGSFYSPGFDVNANLDSESQTKHDNILASFSNNKTLTSLSRKRERVPVIFGKVFLDGGFKSTAISIGSINIRSFINQFGDTGPLENDTKQDQNIQERVSNIKNKFQDNFPENVDDIIQSGLLISSHILKPFIVDPRIDIGVKPGRNRIAAPFLFNKSQLKIFQGKNSEFGSLKRPFIERVINVRFNAKNQISSESSNKVNDTLNNIKNNDSIIDQTLLLQSNNPSDQLYNSDQVVFNNYFKLMRKLVLVLVKSLQFIKNINSDSGINFLPIPDSRNGVESGATGGSLQDPINDDNGNKEIERQILLNQARKTLSDISLATDMGLDGNVDSGDFVFSNLDDMVFVANKNAQKSLEDNLNKMISRRDKIGNKALEALKNIEIIMGEFSGLGLIDIVAIQAAFWLMEPNQLLCLIDDKAYSRALTRQNINLPTSQPINGVISALTEFETKLKSVYLIIQTQFDQVMNGKYFQSS